MEVYRRSSGLLLLLGLSLLATTLQGVQGEVESEGPSESECRPYIEKALKELEAGEAVISSAEKDDGDSKEDIPTVEVTTDDSAHQESEGEKDDNNEDESKENDQLVSEKIEPEVRPTVIQKIASFFQKVFQRTPSKKEEAANESKQSDDKQEDSNKEQASVDEKTSKELDAEDDSKETDSQQDGDSKEVGIKPDESVELQIKEKHDDSTENVNAEDEESREQDDNVNSKENVDQAIEEQKEDEQNDNSKENQTEQGEKESEEHDTSLEERIEAEIVEHLTQAQIQQQDGDSTENKQETEDQKENSEEPVHSDEDPIRSEEVEEQAEEEVVTNNTVEESDEHEKNWIQESVTDDSKEVKLEDSQEDKAADSKEEKTDDSSNGQSVDTKEDEKVDATEDEKVDSKEDDEVDSKEDDKINSKENDKIDSKEDDKVDSKEDDKVNSKEDDKVDSKEDDKINSKEDDKIDSKEDDKVDSKEDQKGDLKEDQKLDSKDQLESTDESKESSDTSRKEVEDRYKRSIDRADVKEELTHLQSNEDEERKDESVIEKAEQDDKSEENLDLPSEEQIKKDENSGEEIKHDQENVFVKGDIVNDKKYKEEQSGKENTEKTEQQNENASEPTEDKSEESKDGGPVEDLSLDTEIPTNLRPRDHVEHLLKVDDDSSESEKIINKVSDITLRDLKKLYENAIKPLEVLYKYRDLSNRHFGDSEIFSKPLILFMGPWSGGKSSIINYLTNNEFNDTALRTGAEPSPAYFNILMYGDEPEIIEGTELAADFTFSGLQKFGQGLEERLRGVRLPSKLLEKVNIVEIPGILEVRKQVSRVFPFNDACQWFIDRGDIIFLVYDPSKLDVGPETEAILDQLKGREHQTRIILNKADQVKPEELMRVQGALIWNISPLMSSPQPPIMYTTSLWSRPYEPWAPVRLLQAQERAFLRDLRGAIDKRIENKIASARRFAVRVRNHAKMVDCYLTTYYNHKSVFGNRKQVADAIIEHPQDYHIYEGLSTLTNISRYDLPDPDVYKDFFKLNPLYEFQQLSATCTYFRGCPINRLDIAIAYDLPELLGTHRRRVESALSETASGSQQTSVPSS